MPLNPDIRLKQEYGGVKAALEYCVSLGLNKLQSAKQLEIDRETLRERAKRFNIEFPNGYATRDRTLTREIRSKFMSEANRDGRMGGKVRWGNR